jgi:hypothetical protein
MRLTHLQFQPLDVDHVMELVADARSLASPTAPSLAPLISLRAKATLGCKLGEIAKPILRSRSGAIPFDPQHGPNANVVPRPHDAQKFAQAKRAVEDMLERVRRAQSN